MTEKQKERIIYYLKKAIRSEDPLDYGDEDCTWGPALGAAAHEACNVNKEIKELIRALGGEPVKNKIKTVVMTFGKHKGTRITKLPHAYLNWVVGVVKPGKLKIALEAELQKRGPYIKPRRKVFHYMDHEDLMMWECPLNG